jgi:hypothetical protein
MCVYLLGVNILEEDEEITQEQEFDIQRNMQATPILLGSLRQEEFDKVDGMDSAELIWDTLQINHEGTRKVHEERIRALEGELNRFIIHEYETPHEMFNRLNKIVNKIRSFGGEKWSDKDMVDKILTAYMARYVYLPTLIREKRKSGGSLPPISLEE